VRIERVPGGSGPDCVLQVRHADTDKMVQECDVVDIIDDTHSPLRLSQHAMPYDCNESVVTNVETISANYPKPHMCTLFTRTGATYAVMDKHHAERTGLKHLQMPQP
jgi:hypothetical protein